MRIYGNTLEGEAQNAVFNQCMQQTLWVKCENLAYKYHGGHKYIYILPRSLQKDNWGGDRVNGYYVGTRSDTFESGHPRFDYECGWFDISTGTGIRVSDPVETFTTEELFGIDRGADLMLLEKISQKPYWVLVQGPIVGTVYLRVLNIQGDIADVMVIPEPCVFLNDSGMCNTPPSESFKTIRVDLKDITVVQPTSVLTDSELNDAVDESDRFYWGDYEMMYGGAPDEE